MKKNVSTLPFYRSGRIFTAVFIALLLGFISVRAQVVTFTQTTDSDFNKGVFNNVIGSGDNVYLQFGATDVGSWLTTTVLPQTLSGHRAVSWNDDYAYVIGGWNNTDYVNTVYYASISSGGIGSWTATTALPVALRDPAVVIGNNTIYVMGGRNATQVFNTIYYATINSNGTLGTWNTSAVTLPVNLWGHTATYVMGYIYVVGGTSSLTETTALNNVYYTKVNATNLLSSFTAGTSLPAARNRHSAVTYNSKLYILGGYDNSGTKASTVYINTPALTGVPSAWSTGTSLPSAVSNHSSVVTNGIISVMAGAVGATLSNTVYYANADNSPLVWSTSVNVMYDYTKDGSAFTGNGQVYYTGGVNLSGTPIINCRFANMTLTANYIAHGVFVSNPFYELGALRTINQMLFTKATGAGANFQITYRTAGTDGVWSDWASLTTTSPVTIGLSRQYLQYAVLLTGSGASNATLNDVSITTPGTQLNGNLNGITTFTKAASPYWATSDISFTAGTHVFEAGATILFMPETGLSVGQAHVECNGTAADSVKFLYYTTETGKWDGIYFGSDSDVGVNSTFNYTVIANAGFGSNNANLYCYQTNEPLLTRCNIRGADGNGIRMNSAHLNIQNSTVRNNTENGLYLENSNPSIVSSTITYNGGAGVYYTSAGSNPNFNSTATVISYNQSGIRYPSPNNTFNQPSGKPTIVNNTYNGIAIDGGYISSSQRWNAIPYDYILLGTIFVGEYGTKPRLTIEPGNNLKFLPGTQLQIGYPCCYGGELYAIGTADSAITFTSHNGAAGGWEGIYFTDQSDNWGGQSQLHYCVIEKGNAYNYYSVNTSQPNLISNSIIQNGLSDGARYASAAGTITGCQFLNNGRYPLFLADVPANPVHTGNTFTGNDTNYIVLSGGTYYMNRTLNLDGTSYLVLDNMTIGEYGAKPRLTIDPGVTVSFLPGKKLQIGYPCCYGGELYAVGTSASPIIFRAFNTTAGGWEGIYFADQNDNWGGVSTMEYCRVRHGASQNILIEGSGQPTIRNCTIRESAGHGIVCASSSVSITNNWFIVNAAYPLKINDWNSNVYNKNNIYLNNTMNYIALAGGSYESNRTVYYDGAPYHVLGNIEMVQYGGHPRLTVQPGVTMFFDPGKYIRLGAPCCYGGEIWAEGKADSLISFKPYNNTAGGWGGLYFSDLSDAYSSNSLLKYCYIEKGNNYNIFCTGTSQPTMQYCTLTGSTGSGLSLDNSSITIKRSSFINNTQYGIYNTGSSVTTVGNTDSTTNNLFNNGLLEFYNNSTADVNARYNFFGTGDSTMIAQRIFDKSDNASKGRVYIGTFAQVPSLMTTNTTLGGTLKYVNTGANPIKNAAMSIKTFAGTTVATTTSNTSGVYAFPAFASGNYRMTITPAAAWGGCNSTDALGILNHFTQTLPLTGINLAAADVNYSHSANGTDAMLVMRRYSGAISSFPAGDYLYSTDTLIVSGGNATYNLDMICFGDVNASYGPAKKSSASLGMVHEGSLTVESGTEFDFPVTLKTGMQVGAISLGFYYPSDLLEVTGARLSNGYEGFSWTAADGLFRMGWCDQNVLNVNNDEVIVILRMKALDLSDMTSGIYLNLYEECEFADGSATPNELAVISIPVINSPLTGIHTTYNRTGLAVYPNPVSDHSVISFNVQENTRIRIEMLDMVGKPVRELVNGDFETGAHKIALNSNGLTPGIYFLKLTGKTGELSFAEMIKFVVSY